MNVLFLTLIDMVSVDDYGIYQDLLRQMMKMGHQVYVVSPSERRTGQPTRMIDGDCKILKVKIGNTTKTNIIEKGISTVMIEPQFKAAIRKYLSHVKFDLVMYSTPPITFAEVVKYIKKRDGAKSYLLLKDIFPQNAVDLGMMCKSGVKSAIYRFFRWKEEQLYAASDRIGCMSEANVKFVLENNPSVAPDVVEVCPNSVEIRDLSLSEQERQEMRRKYGIPEDKKVFVYGGNLGKPQGIPFLMECLQHQMDNANAYFLVVGSGTEFGKLQTFFDEKKPENMKLMQHLPKEDYDRLVAACDVGMIFLDHRFTIPNFPSRLLSYMQAKLPVLVCTDPNTDIGQIAENGGFGWWCESCDADAFDDLVCQAMMADLTEMGEKAYQYMKDYYSVEDSAATVCRFMQNQR